MPTNPLFSFQVTDLAIDSIPLEGFSLADGLRSGTGERERFDDLDKKIRRAAECASSGSRDQEGLARRRAGWAGIAGWIANQLRRIDGDGAVVDWCVREFKKELDALASVIETAITGEAAAAALAEGGPGSAAAVVIATIKLAPRLDPGAFVEVVLFLGQFRRGVSEADVVGYSDEKRQAFGTFQHICGLLLEAVLILFKRAGIAIEQGPVLPRNMFVFAMNRFINDHVALQQRSPIRPPLPARDWVVWSAVRRQIASISELLAGENDEEILKIAPRLEDYYFNLVTEPWIYHRDDPLYRLADTQVPNLEG